MQCTLVAGITVVTALAAMVIHASFICYLAFCLPLILAPWSIIQRRWINKAPTIRGQVQLCRENVARLTACNLDFAKENERLTRETQRLQRIQTQLAETVQKQGGNLHDLRALIKENGEIQRQIKVCVKMIFCERSKWRTKRAIRSNGNVVSSFD